MLSTPKAKAELFLASSLYDGLEDNNIMQITTLLLNKEADPNVLIPSQGIAPFHLVIGNDSETFAEEVTKLFLRHGGNPNVKSVDGMTPVHVAAAWGRLGVLELLLSNGGDPLLIDNEGRCPFHYAFDEAHYDAVATLGKYCGESFEEDLDPKYRVTLDKILVSDGGVVGEYAVQESTCFTSVGETSAFCTTIISTNNNDNLAGKARLSAIGRQAKDYVSELYAKYTDIDATITTSADESSVSLNVRRHRRCLPQQSQKTTDSNSNYKNESACMVKAARRHHLNTVDAEEQRSVSHSMVEKSFTVETKKVGEKMPRVSSPKTQKHLIKSDYVAGIQNQDVKKTTTLPRDTMHAARIAKIVHKTPLRCCPKRGGPLSGSKTAPAIPKKALNLKSKSVSHNENLVSYDRRRLVHKPIKLIPKQCSYSPNSSILSKSPNLMATPKTPRTPTIRSNGWQVHEEGLVHTIGGRSVSFEKNSMKMPRPYWIYKTPTIENRPRVFYNGNDVRNFSHFVKQSKLRQRQVSTITPSSSTSNLLNSSSWPKKSARTSNLTDSTKQKRKCLAKAIRTVFKSPYSMACSPGTLFNKTYNKNEYFNTSSLSPELDNQNRFINRRELTKKIAVNLEKTMYGDDCDESIRLREVNKMQKLRRTVHPPVHNDAMTNSECCIAAKVEVSGIVDNYSNPLDAMINVDHLTSIEHSEISGENNIADLSSSLFCHNTRGSWIIAGYLRSINTNVSLSQRRKADGMESRASVIETSRPHSILSNWLVMPHPQKCNLEYKMQGNSDRIISTTSCIKSGEIDESVIVSESSVHSCNSYSCGDTAGSSECSNKDLSIEPGHLFNTRIVDHNDLLSSELAVPRNQSSTTYGISLTNFNADSEKPSVTFCNLTSSVDGLSYVSCVSIEEEYKYEDVEEGVILLERRFLLTPVSIPTVKKEGVRVMSPSISSSVNLHDQSTTSHVSTLPHSLILMDSETLRRELTKLDGRAPGPITATTRHVYLKRLWKLQSQGPSLPSVRTSIPPKFSAEVERTLRSECWMNDLSPYEALEHQVFREFANPDPMRRWREGTIKSSFNYLLMDPRITDNLPRRIGKLSSIELWRTFLSSIFYVGKGKRSRPYAHMYEAYGEWKKGTRDANDKKVNCILDIWHNNCGIVCLHLFQNTIPVEAYTREAAMIDALGLERLKNTKVGNYYGMAATWSHHQRRTLGVYLLYKAMHIFINEGERQLKPDNIGR